jgi:3-hydroxyacyl-[acyl-carrier-protein] dehydratase
MRWFWIDRFTEFVSGKYATAVKNVALSEEPVDEYVPGLPTYPSTLIIEGYAQMGGLLINQLSDFRERVLLGKINKSMFFFEARPGDQLQMRVDLVARQDGGGVIAGSATIDGRQQSEVELMFVYLNLERFVDNPLFEPAGFCRVLRLLRVFDVGRYEDGSRIQVPQHLIDAERAEGLVT